MKKALVYSVPGTGTRFAREFLDECLGYKPLPLKELMSMPFECRYFSHHHVNANGLRRLTENKRNLRTVIPLRSPVAMYLTRRKEMGYGQRARDEAKALWKDLMESIHRYDHVFLPVEEPQFSRHNKMVLVAQHLDSGVDSASFEQFEEQWPKVGTSGVKRERLEYDRDGDVRVEEQNMSFLDKEMDWYDCQIEAYDTALGKALATL